MPTTQNSSNNSNNLYNNNLINNNDGNNGNKNFIKKSSHDDQDNAFFGDDTKTVKTTTKHDDNDRKLALELQYQLNYQKDNDYSESSSVEHQYQYQYLLDLQSHLERMRSQERKDRELALTIQQQNDEQDNVRRQHDGLYSYAYDYSHDADDDIIENKMRQEKEDEKLAKALQDQEGHNHNHNNDDDEYPKYENETTANKNNKSVSNMRVGGYHQRRPQISLTSLIPRCTTCNKIVTFPIHALGNLYHQECFRCVACHGLIQPNEKFAISTSSSQNGFKNYPMHKNCYTDLYGLKCSVCRNTIQDDNDGRVSYIKHPFFEEIMCPTHSDQRRCTGCHRFEPIGTNHAFADLCDANRCVCYSCCRTVIVDSDDAKPLWDKILQFFERELKLPIFRGMADIPVLIVPHDALNSQLQNSNHRGSSQIMTRGLCLSEHQIGWNLMLPSLRFDRKVRSFMPSDVDSKGHTYFRIPDASKSNPQTSVTAVLCLTGLPRDLSASILAHEATHAWIKLHPSFDPTRPIPPQVEEGCCQLVAMLFLNDGLDKPSSSHNGDEGPSDEKLRQYFKFSIETDTNEIYGEGYRKAARAYAQIGIEALLSHVVNYHEFPIL